MANKSKNGRKTILIGIITGFANGLFGSGGGTVVVPCMEKYLGIDAHKSHATAIAVILPLSVLSAVIYFFKANIPWLETAVVSAVVHIAVSIIVLAAADAHRSFHYQDFEKKS
ncbi:MAG: sulfite exporter TauE/SafE family protein [Clostridiales bacterium]|nr:sulfite exporter TauE/SafE family protein [Clostridiales bacterium]